MARIGQIRRTTRQRKGKRNPLGVLPLLVPAIGVAMIGIGWFWRSVREETAEAKAWEASKEMLFPSPAMPSVPKPPTDIISPPARAVGDVIYSSQKSWQQSLQESLIGPDTARDYTTLWVVGIGLVLALGLRK